MTAVGVGGRRTQSRVFMTAYVVSGLAQAKSAGYAKAETNLGGGVSYLQKQLAQHPRMIPELRAYVVYALSLAGARNLGPSIETALVAAQRSFRRRAGPDRHGDAARQVTGARHKSRRCWKRRPSATARSSPGRPATTRCSM